MMITFLGLGKDEGGALCWARDSGRKTEENNKKVIIVMITDFVFMVN